MRVVHFVHSAETKRLALSLFRVHGGPVEVFTQFSMSLCTNPTLYFLDSRDSNIRNTEEGLNTPLGCYTGHGPWGCVVV